MKEEFTTNARRWYDKDPVLSSAMKTLEESDDETQIKVALNQIQKPLDTTENCIIEAQSNNMKFIRRNKKSTTLIEKSRLGNSIFKEELKLCVQNKSLVGESGDDPTKKYDIISKLGDGSYGTVFLAINFLTKSKVAIKKIVKVKENEIEVRNKDKELIINNSEKLKGHFITRHLSWEECN